MTKFGPKLAFLVNLGQAYSVPCWWVGWWSWCAGCISQDTYLLYIWCNQRHGFWTLVNHYTNACVAAYSSQLYLTQYYLININTRPQNVWLGWTAIDNNIDIHLISHSTLIHEIAIIRLMGPAGTHMPEHPVGDNKCGTHATGWLSG